MDIEVGRRGVVKEKESWINFLSTLQHSTIRWSLCLRRRVERLGWGALVVERSECRGDKSDFLSRFVVFIL